MTTALDLFCGAAGGWSLGLHWAGVTTVAACEIDDWRRAVFAANNPGVKMYSDVRDVTAARLRSALGFLPDWIVGSPPCQDASCANIAGRGVDGERTGLFFEAVRLVDECRPRWAILENVPGLRTRGADRVLAALEALGYACWPLVVGAWHAGAPHRRNRVWIIAANADRAPRAKWQGIGSDVCQKQPPLERGPARSWADFISRAGGNLRAFDGVPDRMAVAAADAYGDAVMPQITCALARSILRVP